MLDFMRNWWRHFKAMWSGFYKHGGPTMAAAISFYSLLSVVPLSMFGLSLAGLIVGSPKKAADIILSFVNIQNMFPEGVANINKIATKFVSQAPTATVINGFLLFVLSGGVFLVIESAINKVFEVTDKRPLWRQLLMAYFLMFLTYVSLLGSAFFTWGVNLLSDLGVVFLGMTAKDLSTFWKIVFFIAPIILVSFFFSLTYKIVPQRKVRWRYAIFAGLFSGIMWEIAKRIFTIYVKYIVRFNQLYGGISTILATYLWVFYTASIMLLGGELAMSFIKSTKLAISET